MLRERERAVVSALLVAILAGSFALQLMRLRDSELTIWDESFHAIVAQNLLKHPLQPTLIDRPYLPYDYTNWHQNHVWMHKPILPLWQIAASFAVLGVDRFSLRLPSAILATAAVLLTFLIGRRLVDGRAGLVAAAVQAASPTVVKLVHGSLFADHVDVSLLFWTELSILFLLRTIESGRWRDVLVCGVAQGCAYLSKSYLAAIVTGLSVVAWALARRGVHYRAAVTDETGPAKAGRGPQPARSAGRGGGGPAFRLRHVLGILGAALLTIAPWTLYAFLNYRNEFLYEYAAWWHHLAGEWEDWGAPWQRVVFDYLPSLHLYFYVPVAVAALALVVPAIREKSFGLLFLLAWVVGVFLPHFVAPTKTPTATLIAVPPLVVLLGALVARAFRGDLWSQAAWAGVAIAGVLEPAVIVPPNRGYALEPGLESIAGKNSWVLPQVGIALGVAAVVYAVGAWLARGEGRARACRAFRTALVILALLGSLWLFARFGRAASRSLVRSEDLGYAELGAFSRRSLPANAVLLVRSKFGYEHQLAMFYADRTAYEIQEPPPNELVAGIRRAGGEPYLVTPGWEGHTPMWQGANTRATIYRIP